MNVLTPTNWVITTLLADESIAAEVGDRVYLDAIPQQVTPAYPYIVVSKVPGDPVTNANVDIIMFDDLVDVDVHDRSPDVTRAAKILGLVFTALHKTKGVTADGGVVIGCVFVAEIPFPPEVEDRVIFQRKSAEFQVFTQ